MVTAGPSLAFVRIEEREPNVEEHKASASPLPLFAHAEVLEIGAPFAGS